MQGEHKKALEALCSEREKLRRAKKETTLLRVSVDQLTKARSLESAMRKNFEELTQSLKKQNAQLKRRNLSMAGEQKEMEVTLNELRQGNAHRSRWRQWNTIEVFEFIVDSVDDGSLKQYEEAIKVGLAEQEYTGSVLADISNQDLLLLGIKSIALRKSVLRAISELVAGSKQRKPQRLRTWRAHRLLICSDIRALTGNHINVYKVKSACL